MVSPPDIRPPDSDRLLQYEVSAEESLSDAVLRAAGTLLDDLTSVRPLSSVIDVESIDTLFDHRRDAESGSDTRVIAFVAWDLQFVVTASTIEVYEADTPLE
ncbi:HalOD1 output domain-containing protein [Salinigranum halophilum]|jgi:hypothetical protein|uniref:HalOD1 output domain-containing protein n=1 Tax=Salinigranum halophilum TaxID=2565931 RepID=UPI0010A7B230|nr:HalOD1 output domain-containing protein [Salinigranum halophilum]